MDAALFAPSQDGGAGQIIAAGGDGEDRDNAEAVAALDALCRRFCFEERDGQPPDVMEQLRLVYGYGAAAFSAQVAFATYEDSATQAATLSSWAEEAGDADSRARISQVLHCIQESYSALCAVTRWTGHAQSVTMSDYDMILRFVRSDGDKDLPVQTVYRFILSHTHRMQLRHREDTVFCQKYTDAGLPTHAWVAAKDVGGHDISTIEKMVAFCCTKAHNASVWLTWVAVNTKAVCDKLRICLEPEFKMLHTSRAWLAFADGLWNVYTDCFVPYGQTTRFGIPPSLAACAYHNCRFAPVFERAPGQPGLPLHPMVEVETPLLDRIMDTQKLCGHTRYWLLCMLGRCLYFSGVLEAWQVCLYLRGRAGTGKSTLVQLMTSVYEPDQAVIISNDAQTGFGLQSLNSDVYLWAVPECKADFNVDQASFQSLVSHERMSINRKFLPTFQGVIRAHGIIAGNELPLRWVDNSGSIKRRLFIIEFNVEVPKSDSTLLERLCTVELPAILRKINWAYRHAAVLLNGSDLWQSGLMSDHILRQNEGVYSSMNSLRSYLISDEMSIDAAEWCPLGVFQESFKAFCKLYNKPTQQWTNEFISTPFRDSGVKLRKATYSWDGEPPVTGTVVHGACLRADRDKQGQADENPVYAHVEIDEVDYVRVAQ